MRKLCVLIAATLSAVSLSAQAPAVVEALDGVDPVVLLTQGKEVFGKAEFRVERGRYAYLFATAASKAAFEASPDKYEIQLGGLCARMGRGAMGNPSDFAVVDGRIYVFGSDECHKAFVAAPAKYLPPPAVPLPEGAAARQSGRALLDRAVAAVGGAARLDGLRSYSETDSRMQRMMQRESRAITKVTWRFPGDVRMDRTVDAADRPMRFGMLLTPAGVWSINMQGAFVPAPPPARPAYEMEYGRRLLPLLRNRETSGFVAVGLGRGTFEGAAVERVRVTHGSVDATLAIDAATGVVRGMTFVDRGPGGEYGEYTVIYGDYRDVAGVKIPFEQRALFNGVADPAASRTLDAAAIDEAIDPSLFTARGAQ
jgi:YHS domain-containing protein